MPRFVSLNARSELELPYRSRVLVTLLEISHPDWSEPLRFSSDNTERISDDPLTYGTRHGDAVFLFAGLGLQVPAESETAAPSTTVVIDDIGGAAVAALKCLPLSPLAKARFIEVFADDSATVEAEWRGLDVRNPQATETQISLEVSRWTPDVEPWPAHRQTKARFPGLHR